MQSSLTYPPYSKYLREFLKSGRIPNNDIFIFMGAASWSKARNFQIQRPTSLCLPPHSLPIDYIWPVSQCDILIFDTSESNASDIEDFATLLFAYNARIVRYCSYLNKLTVFKKDF